MMGGAWFRLIHSATGNKMAVSCWQSFTAAEVRNWWFFLGDFNAEGMQRSIVSEITQQGRLWRISPVLVCLSVCVSVSLFFVKQTQTSPHVHVFISSSILCISTSGQRGPPLIHTVLVSQMLMMQEPSLSQTPTPPPTSHRRPATTLNLQPPSRLSCIHHLLYRFDFFHNNAYKQIIGFKG